MREHLGWASGRAQDNGQRPGRLAEWKRGGRHEESVRLGLPSAVRWWLAPFSASRRIRCGRNYAGDRAEIDDLLSRHLLAPDRRGAGAHASFFEDGVLNYRGTVNGRDAIVAEMIKARAADAQLTPQRRTAPFRRRYFASNFVQRIDGTGPRRARTGSSSTTTRRAPARLGRTDTEDEPGAGQRPVAGLPIPGAQRAARADGRRPQESGLVTEMGRPDLHRASPIRRLALPQNGRLAQR